MELLENFNEMPKKKLRKIRKTYQQRTFLP